MTTDSAGGVHASFLRRRQDVTGVGLTSGTRYRSVRVEHSSFTVAAASLPFTASDTSVIHLISEDGSSNLLVVFTTHFTLNAHGEVTAVAENYQLRCTGAPE